MTVERKPFAVLGLASCALFLASALAFVRWWIKLGVYPVLRGTTAVTSLTGFQEFWTRVFLVAGLVGLTLGALGAWRGSRPRIVALAGLILNVGAIAVVLVLTSTGSFPP